MLLKKPYIATEGKYWKQYIDCWANFTEEYNCQANGEPKPLSKQLRGVHKQTYFQLVQRVKRKINSDNRYLSENGLNAIDPTKPYSIRLTRKQLGLALGVSTDTAHRYITRLIKAGVLTKEKHGTRRAFELLIKPDFLFIYCYNQPEYTPTSKFLSTKECGFQSQLHASCTHINCVTKEHSNNEIIPVDNSTDKNDSCASVNSGLLKEQDKNFYKNNQKQINSGENSKLNETESQKLSQKPEQKKEKGCAQKEKKRKMQELKRSFASRLYNYMVEILFINHSIYEAEKENAILYLEQYYLRHITNHREGERALHIYKSRVKMASSYIRRKAFDFSNIYPCAYLDINNPKGFRATAQWWIQSENDAKKKAIARAANSKRLSDTKKLAKIIQTFNERPNLATFNTCKGYVKQRIPHLFQEFIAGTNIRIQP